MYFLKVNRRGLPYCNFISQKQKSLCTQKRQKGYESGKEKTKAKQIPSMNKGLEMLLTQLLAALNDPIAHTIKLLEYYITVELHPL
jgi:flagellar biosynthesis/type III secretory pathway protein FliH